PLQWGCSDPGHPTAPTFFHLQWGCSDPGHPTAPTFFHLQWGCFDPGHPTAPTFFPLQWGCLDPGHPTGGEAWKARMSRPNSGRLIAKKHHYSKWGIALARN
ncbi:MAG: hypothetical protein ACI4DN_04905, partial [Lachnospiraceae bacterium]